ncbi:MAG TPA: RNA polymerase sigma factor [Planctomycetota bacterium]|nr:RNA polymerase sigma factor [Planctomycetota bacterium]
MGVRAESTPVTGWDLEAFFQEFYPKIHRVVSIASGASTEEVDDLVQEALLEAWRERDSFRSESSIDTWILSIARNRVRRRYRKEGRRKEIREMLSALASLESLEIPEQLLQARETGRHVRAALDRLDPAHAQVLILKYVDERSVAWIAATLGESEKAIESRLVRAREDLRLLLKGTLHDAE